MKWAKPILLLGVAVLLTSVSIVQAQTALPTYGCGRDASPPADNSVFRLPSLFGEVPWAEQVQYRQFLSSQDQNQQAPQDQSQQQGQGASGEKEKNSGEKEAAGEKEKKKEEKKEGDKSDDAEKKDDEKTATPQCWNLHAQTTAVAQGDPGFPAKYSGPNSLSSRGDRQQTLALDLFAGVRLWCGAEMHVDALMWEGFGLSDTFGVEAFPNGDAYKAGTEIPDFMFARFFVRQTFGLGGEQEDVKDDQLTLAGKQDISRLTFTVGRFTPTTNSTTTPTRRTRTRSS